MALHHYERSAQYFVSDASTALPPGTESGQLKPLRYIELVNSVTSELPPLPIATLGRPILTRLKKSLRESRVIIVTSAGIGLKSEPRFRPTNDMTFRRIPQVTPGALLAPSHPTPVRRAGELDINVVFPRDRMAELAAEGVIGSVAPFDLSFLGTIKKLTILVAELAVEMARAAREAEADAALMVPL
jgi:D-proline reductase (dithiol) PrdB